MAWHIAVLCSLLVAPNACCLLAARAGQAMPLVLRQREGERERARGSERVLLCALCLASPQRRHWPGCSGKERGRERAREGECVYECRPMRRPRRGERQPPTRPPGADSESQGRQRRTNGGTASRSPGRGGRLNELACVVQALTQLAVLLRLGAAHSTGFSMIARPFSAFRGLVKRNPRMQAVPGTLQRSKVGPDAAEASDIVAAPILILGAHRNALDARGRRALQTGRRARHAAGAPGTPARAGFQAY